MATESRPWPDEAIPPGETLAETLEAVGMSQAELAWRSGRPPQVVNEIVHGRKEITAETAIEFERVLGVPAHVWQNLEAQYKMVRARLAETRRLQEEVPLAKSFPYDSMARLSWVPNERNALERVRALLQFFAVASLDKVTTEATWRRANLKRVSEYALAVWLRQGEISARRIDVHTFDEARLRDSVYQLPQLSRERPEKSSRKLVERLAAVGVALVFVPHLPRTGAQGATRWISGRPIVQLSVRYSWADVFWFTLFHELGHVLRHGRKEVFVDFSRQDTNEQEQQANRFAVEHLISDRAYRAFVSARTFFSRTDVLGFADQINVHAGIIVGRLQHDRKIPRSHLNGLRERYILSNRG